MISEGNSFVKRAWSALGSLRLFWWISMFIVGIFLIGCIVGKGGIDPGVSSSLDGEILLRWLTGTGGHSYPFIRAWIIGIILLVFLLGVNLSARLIFDIGELWRLFLEWKNSDTTGSGLAMARKFSLVLMHSSIILLLLVHAISSTTGFKISGFELHPGKIIQHKKLPYALYCQKIIMSKRDPRGGPSRPTVVLKPMVADANPFMIPKPPWGSGLHDGYFYRIYAEYTIPKSEVADCRERWKRRKLIALKLGINRIYGIYPLLAVGVLFLSGAALHMVLRQELWVRILRWRKRLTFSKENEGNKYFLS